MAYVVSATWTAEPGQEDVVLDAIEKLTPPSREEPGNRLLPGLPGPGRADGLPPVRDLRGRGRRTPPTVPPSTSRSSAHGQAIPVLANRERAFYETIG